jgi:hypothetical protein
MNFIARETCWVSSEVAVSMVQVNIVPLDCIAKSGLQTMNPIQRNTCHMHLRNILCHH